MPSGLLCFSALNGTAKPRPPTCSANESVARRARKLASSSNRASTRFAIRPRHSVWAFESTDHRPRQRSAWWMAIPLNASPRNVCLLSQFVKMSAGVHSVLRKASFSLRMLLMSSFRWRHNQSAFPQVVQVVLPFADQMALATRAARGLNFVANNIYKWI